MKDCHFRMHECSSVHFACLIICFHTVHSYSSFVRNKQKSYNASCQGPFVEEELLPRIFIGLDGWSSWLTVNLVWSTPPRFCFFPFERKLMACLLDGHLNPHLVQNIREEMISERMKVRTRDKRKTVVSINWCITWRRRFVDWSWSGL